MEYTIQKFAKLTGVTTRTLRWYDTIGLLHPARINESGYRVYGSEQADRLQRILFYREVGMSLEGIEKIVSDPGFDPVATLYEHKLQLLEKRKQLNTLIANVEQTIKAKQGKVSMNDQQKFKGFKKKLVEDNNKKYGAEVREKYGDKVQSESNQKVLNMTPEQFAMVEKLEAELFETLAQAFALGDPASDIAQKAADLHRQWLSFYWPTYSKEAHAGLAEMYVSDERFTVYYDSARPGTAVFLRDAILIYTSRV